MGRFESDLAQAKIKTPGWIWWENHHLHH